MRRVEPLRAGVRSRRRRGEAHRGGTVTRPSEEVALYRETADSFREVKKEIEEVRGHGVARTRVVEYLMLLHRQHGLPYEDPRKR